MAGALVVLAIAAAGCDLTGSARTSTTEEGPLTFTSGHMTYLMAPQPHPMFASLPGCLTSDDSAHVQIDAVEAAHLSGTGDVEFQVAWPSDEQRFSAGGGRVRSLPDAFAPAERSSGRVQPCGANDPGLILAVLLPVPRDTAVVVDGINVTYQVHGTTHVETIDAVLGSCAARPADPGSEHPGCQR